jgi:uncharacterized membrane protein YfcA
MARASQCPVTMPPFALLAGLALSVLVGVALGLLGGGGSILTLPILVYVLKMDAHAAIATSLLVVGTTSAAALISHARAGRVRWKTGAVFGATSMVGAYAAGRVAHLIPGIVLLLAFGAMMLVTAVAMMRAPRVAEPSAAAEAPLGKGFLWILLEGLAVGAVTGLVGAGGGFLVVPALVLLGKLPMREAVGTSLLVITMKSFAAFAGHAPGVELDLVLAGGITVAAIVGSVGGAAIAGRLPAATLRKAFAWFVLAMAGFLLVQEIPRAFGHPLALARDWPWLAGALLATGVVVAVVVALLRWSRGGGAAPRAAAGA